MPSLRSYISVVITPFSLNQPQTTSLLVLELFGRLLFTWGTTVSGPSPRKQLIDELRSFSITQIMFLASRKETGIKRGQRRVDINLPADS